MGMDESTSSRSKVDEARSLMVRALALLDEADAPAQIGAHLDMAICSLSAALEGDVTQSADCASQPDSCAWSIRPSA